MHLKSTMKLVDDELAADGEAAVRPETRRESHSSARDGRDAHAACALFKEATQ